MELQESLADLERAGVAVFALSYDPVETLRDFAERKGVTYTLLADEGSNVLEELGLINTVVAQQNAYFGQETKPRHNRVAHPGTFILDENGMIVDKRFEQFHRPRETPVRVVEDVFSSKNSRDGATALAENEHLRVEASFGQDTYRPWQRLRLGVEIEIRDGLHVFGGDLPEGYVPLSVDVEAPEAGDALEVGPLEIPAPKSYQMEGLDEQLFIYEGRVRAARIVTLTKLVGDLTLRVRVPYQACAEFLCYPPGELQLELELKGLDLVRD